MHLTICSYPRSGRHRTQAAFAALGDFRMGTTPMEPWSASFFDMMDTPEHYRKVPGARHIADESSYPATAANRLMIHATHHVPSRVRGLKIIVIRHPVAVAVSVAKKWQSELNKSEAEYWAFLEDYVRVGAQYAATKHGGNIWQTDQVDFFSTVNPDDVFLRYESLDEGRLMDALLCLGIKSNSMAPMPRFEELQKVNPIMYRRGDPDAWEQEIGDLRELACRKYRWIIQDFFRKPVKR